MDSERRPLSGAYRYEIHLGKDDVPPVNAFWSVTLHNQDGSFVENPTNRYAISDRDNLQRQADGSLGIHIQRGPPPGNEANWLPAPPGAFRLILRLYWPRDEILSGKWKAPPVRRID